MSNIISTTQLGQVVARSGLQPETAHFFIEFLKSQKDHIIGLLPQGTTADQVVDLESEENEVAVAERRIAFVFSHLCFVSPEYNMSITPPQRSIPYMLADQRREYEDASYVNRILATSWDHDIAATNAARIVLDYSDGVPLKELEDQFEGLSSGAIHGLLRDHVAHLKGLADIIDLVSGWELNADNELLRWIAPTPLDRTSMRRVLRILRVRMMQMVYGVPEDVLWMRDLRMRHGGSRLLNRTLIQELRLAGLVTLEDILDEGRKDVFHQVMNANGVNNDIRQQVLVSAKEHRVKTTKISEERICKRLPECDNLVRQVFNSRDQEFEAHINNCFICLQIGIQGRDGEQSADRYPDFVININEKTVVLECKSKHGDESVSLGGATEIGAKAVAHGLQSHPMVTICQPYVSTDVARKIKTATNLSVINLEDIALAMAMLKQQRISIDKFYSWLTTPGQPRYEELFN